MLQQVAGIVLAAGRSQRMGRPKALLEAGGETFLARTTGALLEGGCTPVVAVTPGPGPIADEARRAGCQVVMSDGEDAEQIDSLIAGLVHLPATTAAAVILPVDHPLVEAATVRRLIARWREAPGHIVRPVHNGRPGHPTIFPRQAWADLAPHLPRGARSVVEEGRHPTADVQVDDPGIAADIDTPEAFARWVEDAPRDVQGDARKDARG